MGFQTDKITAERQFFAFAALIWLVVSGYLCTLGFGADPDAWLMAQTAQKLQLGFGYDPARSAGNPLYEFLIAFLQQEGQWLFSNLASLGVASIILWRLPMYFPENLGIPIFRLMLMVLPWFWEAATSSIETIFALWFWLEAGFQINRDKKLAAALLLLLSSFTRPEYFLLISLTDWRFWKKNNLIWFTSLVFISTYLYWVQGKNPMPFHDLNSAIRFYGGRIFTLIQDPKWMIVIFLFIGPTIWKSSPGNSIFSKGAVVNIGVFCLFPFEWAYLLPFMVVALSRLKVRWKSLVLILSIALPFLQFKSDFHPKLGLPWADRVWKTETFQLAQRADFQQKTILLYGATWLPTDVEAWSKSMQNRLFHRENSYFYLGEKISTISELDSLHKAGFQIVAWKEELGDFKTLNGKIQIPEYLILVEDVERFLQQKRSDKPTF